MGGIWRKNVENAEKLFSFIEVGMDSVLQIVKPMYGELDALHILANEAENAEDYTKKAYYCSCAYEVGMKIKKIYDMYDEQKEKIMKERIYTALKYAPLDDNVYIELLDGDGATLTPIMFVSFNPRPCEHIENCFSAVERYFRNKHILKASFVIEQREEDYHQLGKGFHFHILLLNDYKKLSDFKRDTRRVFQPYCDADRSAVLNFRSNRTKVDAQNRLEYILGQKKNPDKHAKQDGDKEFRKKLGLREYYIYNGGLSIEDLKF